MTIQSPCLARCGLNDDEFCMGCFRHIDEIVGWANTSDSNKSKIIAKLITRKQQFEGERNSQILSRSKWLESESRIMAQHASKTLKK